MKSSLFPVVILIFLALAADLPARTWTNSKGVPIEAELVDVQQVGGVDHAVLQKPGETKTYSFPVADLSEADQKFIAEAEIAAEPAEPAKKGSVYDEELEGKLVALDGKRLSKFEPTKDPEYYAFYFSAHWCPPCRGFTPKLVDFYDKASEGPNGDKFEIVFVSRDRDEEAMEDYMAGDKMNWPAVKFRYAKQLKKVNALAGSGIPCLVVVDREGNVISDSYEGKNYVGAAKVLNDLEKLLEES